MADVRTIVKYDDKLLLAYKSLADTVLHYPELAQELLSRLIEYEVYTGVLSDIESLGGYNPAEFAEILNAIYQTGIRWGANPALLEEFHYHVSDVGSEWYYFAGWISDTIVSTLNHYFARHYLGVEINVTDITPRGASIRLRFEA